MIIILVEIHEINFIKNSRAEQIRPCLVKPNLEPIFIKRDKKGIDCHTKAYELHVH